VKLILTTSNKYTYVCPLNIHFLNKYWPGQEVILLGYEEVERLQNLPENVEVHMLGQQDDYGTSWTDALIPFFQNLEEQHFVVLFDDMILMSAVDPEVIRRLEEEVVTGRAQKALIGGGMPLTSTTKMENGLLVFDQNMGYRATLHPAIWAKDYFLSFLEPNFSPWQFEILNENKARRDGAVIINDDYVYPQHPHTFTTLNLYSKGNITINKNGEILDNQPSAKYFDKEDLLYIWEKINAS
tara:strand:+ start:13118 stop:13840 length:723 start_codon:yes stop_codon:yes gene_type:complete